MVRKKANSRLRRLNNFLTLIVVALAVYIFCLPLLPSIGVWWKTRNGPISPYSGSLSQFLGNRVDRSIPDDNRVVIPNIAVNSQIKEGPDIAVASDDGVWHRPNSSFDPAKSNMVLAGHRFAYSHPYGAFYSLDKVKIGDRLALYWQKKEYMYRVVETKVIEPTVVEIEGPTSKPTLTLYTCTPIWSASQRLVVRAELINNDYGAKK